MEHIARARGHDAVGGAQHLLVLRDVQALGGWYLPGQHLPRHQLPPGGGRRTDRPRHRDPRCARGRYHTRREGDPGGGGVRGRLHRAPCLQVNYRYVGRVGPEDFRPPRRRSARRCPPGVAVPRGGGHGAPTHPPRACRRRVAADGHLAAALVGAPQGRSGERRSARRPATGVGGGACGRHGRDRPAPGGRCAHARRLPPHRRLRGAAPGAGSRTRGGACRGQGGFAAGPRGRRLSGRGQVGLLPAERVAPLPRRQRRRERAGHLQGPPAHGARTRTNSSRVA